MARPKKRLDLRAAELFPDKSRAQLQSWIMQGRVICNGVPMTKSGTLVDVDTPLELRLPEVQYVSRAGYKLAGALDAFGIDVRGKIAMDAGISTGGFTDCLLQRGVVKVYGIDVGYGIVHESLRHDPRVVLMERTNLRNVTGLPEQVDLVTLDLSFISVTKVLSVVRRVLKPGGILLVLIKPQFEAGYAEVSRGEGVITDPAVHERVIATVRHELEQNGFAVHGVVPSSVVGSSGNQEFLAYATLTSPAREKSGSNSH